MPTRKRHRVFGASAIFSPTSPNMSPESLAPLRSALRAQLSLSVFPGRALVAPELRQGDDGDDLQPADDGHLDFRRSTFGASWLGTRARVLTGIQETAWTPKRPIPFYGPKDPEKSGTKPEKRSLLGVQVQF